MIAIKITSCSGLTLHEPKKDQRGQTRHRHEQEQDATATTPVHRCPQQEPGTATRTYRQQVRPVEAGGVASDVTSEGAVAMTDAVRDEAEG